MATAATAKPAKVTQTKPEAVEDSLEDVYEELVKILQRHGPPFRSDVPCLAGGKRSFQLTVPKPVVIPCAYGGKPADLPMASAILQNGYVGFYLMCLYMNGAAKKKLSPVLGKLLKMPATRLFKESPITPPRIRCQYTGPEIGSSESWEVAVTSPTVSNVVMM